MKNRERMQHRKRFGDLQRRAVLEAIAGGKQQDVEPAVFRADVCTTQPNDIEIATESIRGVIHTVQAR